MPELEETAQELQGWLSSWQSESVKVLEAKHRIAEDSEGELALFFDLVLSNPEDETWPLDEMLDFRRGFRKKTMESEIDLPVYVVLRPEDEEEQEEEPAVAVSS